jgi:hypothetical protein
MRGTGTGIIRQFRTQRPLIHFVGATFGRGGYPFSLDSSLTHMPSSIIPFWKQASTIVPHFSSSPNGNPPEVSPPFETPPIFGGHFGDYGLKPICRSERSPLKSESGKVSVMDYHWQSSVLRGCFYQVMMQSPSSYRILGRIPCYVASETVEKP